MPDRISEIFIHLDIIGEAVAQFHSRPGALAKEQIEISHAFGICIKTFKSFRSLYVIKNFSLDYGDICIFPMSLIAFHSHYK